MKHKIRLRYQWKYPVAFILSVFLVVLGFFQSRVQASSPQWWTIQSIDTMKYSRDSSREKLSDPSFDRVINGQVAQIAETGATHIAIGTPYDEEFIPILKRWVGAARRHGLQVWFRGNFSGWEKWFGYTSISRDEHKQKTASFIRNHADLFADGDIFTPCPECENGGPGDPRMSGDVAGHRAFLGQLQKTSEASFSVIGKKVKAGYFSMNGDVARLVMDRETTKALGGVVVIDHYVASPKVLHDDIVDYAKRSGGSIVLGEFGVPIPDIHGKMSEEDQAKWIREALTEISTIPEVIGVNYWTGVGGSTELWNAAGTARQGVGVLSSYFKPHTIRGFVLDDLGKPIAGASLSAATRSTTSDITGAFFLPYIGDSVDIVAEAPTYKSQKITVKQDEVSTMITLSKEHESWWFTFLKYLRKAFKIL